MKKENSEPLNASLLNTGTNSSITIIGLIILFLGAVSLKITRIN